MEKWMKLKDYAEYARAIGVDYDDSTWRRRCEVVANRGKEVEVLGKPFKASKVGKDWYVAVAEADLVDAPLQTQSAIGHHGLWLEAWHFDPYERKPKPVYVCLAHTSQLGTISVNRIEPRLVSEVRGRACPPG